MKFKVGDKVKHKDFGLGKIIYIDEEMTAMPYAVQFKIFNNEKWCKEGNLELDKQQSHNLIPQIAKMLGVEIGEEFKISNKPDVYKFTKDRLIGIGWSGTYNTCNTFFELINGKEKIIKLPQKPKLTEDERVILRNLQEKYKYIARDNSGALYFYENKPKKDGNVWSIYGYNYFDLFQHLFQFIKWEDKEPYKIQELLKGE